MNINQWKNSKQHSFSDIARMMRYGLGEKARIRAWRQAQGLSPISESEAARYLEISNGAITLKDLERIARHPRQQKRGHRRGGDNPAAKLTAARVKCIRRNPETPASHFAEKYGVSASIVSQARNGENWSHLPGAVKSNRKWPKDQLALLKNHTPEEIHKLTGKSMAAIYSKRFKVRRDGEAGRGR